MPINVTQVSPTQQEKDGKAFVDYARRFEIKHSDLDASNKFYIPLDAGEVVLAVRVFVKSVYDAVTLTVGDSQDVDAFAETGMLNPASASAFFNSASGSAAGAGGKFYGTPDYLVLTASAPSTKGTLEMDVLFAGYGTGPARGEIKNL